MSREGDIFGPYRLVKQIAVGGMAEIHLAKSEGFSGFEKFVALKMIHPNFSTDSHFVRMLVEEAKITVFLNHVNIGQIFDLGRIGDIYYIAMEFIDGPDCYRIMRRITEQGLEMPCDVAAYIMHEVNAGLDYAHRCRDQLGNPLNIIHRDISPQNIMISRAGEVKVVDFGIAKAALRARQTAVGVIKGKYYYMSPEQAWGEPLDARTDIFSTGVVLYELLSGQMLYLEEDVALLLDMVRRADIPPLSKRRPDVPRELEAVVMKAVAKNPDDRWQSANEFQHALHTFLYRYAPSFNVQKLQAVVHRAVTGRDRNDAPDGRTLSASAQDYMDRQEFTSLTKHSVIFSSEETESFSRPPAFMFSGEEEFDNEEETMISGPPSFSLRTGEDPSLPLVAKPHTGGGDTMGWGTDEEEEPTAVFPNERARVLTGQGEESSTVPHHTPRPNTGPEGWEAETRNFRSKGSHPGNAQVARGRAVPPGPPRSSPAPFSQPPPPPPPRPPGPSSPPGHSGHPGQPVPLSAPQRPQEGSQGASPRLNDWGPTTPDLQRDRGRSGAGWSPPPPGTPSASFYPSGQGWSSYPPGSGAGYTGFDEDFDDYPDEEQIALMRASTRSRRLSLVVLGLLVLIGGLAAILFIFWPFGDLATTGDVKVVTDPPGAHVECDGEPQHGLTPDVLIRNLPADENHSLYITKPGYLPTHKSFSVVPGKEITLKVKLKPK